MDEKDHSFFPCGREKTPVRFVCGGLKIAAL
jgi:hypothetical protein